jgi:hypothetical protein
MAVGLWIPAGSLVQARLAVADMRYKIADPVLSADCYAESFFTADTRPIGGWLNDRGVHLYCVWESSERADEGEHHIERVFGVRPELGAFAISAYVKGDDADRTVAVVAAHLAEQTGGVVNLYFPLDLAAELPGRTTQVPDSSDPRGETALDAIAMRAWSRHPRCWVIG